MLVISNLSCRNDNTHRIRGVWACRKHWKRRIDPRTQGGGSRPAQAGGGGVSLLTATPSHRPRWAPRQFDRITFPTPVQASHQRGIFFLFYLFFSLFLFKDRIHRIDIMYFFRFQQFLFLFQLSRTELNKNMTAVCSHLVICPHTKICGSSRVVVVLYIKKKPDQIQPRFH